MWSILSETNFGYSKEKITEGNRCVCHATHLTCTTKIVISFVNLTYIVTNYANNFVIYVVLNYGQNKDRILCKIIKIISVIYTGLHN